MKTIFTILFTIVVLVTYVNKGNGIKYPFDPNNLLITEMVCIGFVSLFLSIQQNDAQIKGKFLTNTFIRAIPAATCLVLAIGINYILRYVDNFFDFEISADGILNAHDELAFRTLNSLSMTFVALGVAYNCCLPVFPLSDKQNRYRFIGFCITICFVLIGVFGFGNIPATSSDYSSLCQQLAGIDYHYLNKTMWLLLIIYLTGFSSLLSVLVRLAESSLHLAKANTLLVPNPEKEKKLPEILQEIPSDTSTIEEKKEDTKKEKAAKNKEAKGKAADPSK